MPARRALLKRATGKRIYERIVHFAYTGNNLRPQLTNVLAFAFPDHNIGRQVIAMPLPHRNRGGIDAKKFVNLRLVAPIVFTCLFVSVLVVSATAMAAPPVPVSDQLNSVDRGIIEQMLKDAVEAVKKEYFDPNFGGANLNAAYAQARAALAKANSVHEGYEAVANMLRQLDDSHTQFIPPQQPFTVDAGWSMALIGNKCFVTRVKHGSDAEAKGLKPGDEIIELENVKPSRANWEDLNYSINILAPRSSLHLVVVSPGEPQSKAITTKSVVKTRQKMYDLTNNEYWIAVHQEDQDWEKYESREFMFADVQIWQLRNFEFKEDALDSHLRKAEKAKAVIIDLRGNPGGSVDVLTHMIGDFSTYEVQIAQTVKRDKSKPMTAKAGSHPYTGKLIVLVDSRSASCSELFARVMQLEKRAIVIGDRTAGAVREAHIKSFVHGQGTVYAYDVEVTVADLKMSDGQTLEKTGVVPDETLLPTAQQLAAGEDPQLARALELAGVSVTAKKAGSLLPPQEN